jgi:hypothetical protein
MTCCTTEVLYSFVLILIKTFFAPRKHWENYIPNILLLGCKIVVDVWASHRSQQSVTLHPDPHEIESIDTSFDHECGFVRTTSLVYILKLLINSKVLFDTVPFQLHLIQTKYVSIPGKDHPFKHWT